jgi:hypothetical protein
MKEKQKVITGYRSRYRNADRKEKVAILDEVQFITGYNRKYALRILNAPQASQALLVVNGKTVKLKPQKKRPANRKGKKIYADEVIASLRLIWTFFWYKCGRTKSPQFLAPLIRRPPKPVSRRIRALLPPPRRPGRPGRGSPNPGNLPLTPKKFFFAPKKFLLPPKKFSLAPKKFSLTPKKFSLTPKKFFLTPG